MKGYHRNLLNIENLKKRVYNQFMMENSSLRFNSSLFLKIPYKDQYECRDFTYNQNYLQKEKPIIK
jgi:hypothetical protein